MFDQLREAEDLIAVYNYRKALTVLDRLAENGYDDERFHRMRALCLFVEGRSAEGFTEIRDEDVINDNRRKTDAKMMLDAARIIIREKNRFKESITLLDSAFDRNISLKGEIIELLWERGLEYLNVPGAGGFHLMMKASEIDDQIPKRLRRHNRVFYRRYDEINSMYLHLRELRIRVERFHEKYGRYSGSMAELAQKGFISDLKHTREGWRVELRHAGETGYLLTAEALKKNPGDALQGTILNAEDS